MDINFAAVGLMRLVGITLAQLPAALAVEAVQAALKLGDAGLSDAMIGIRPVPPAFPVVGS
jgi:hypothetical protein